MNLMLNARLILILMALLMLIGTAGATDYYVATWGNNVNSGTLESPKQNWSTSWFNSTNINQGDKIYLINGTWNNETIIVPNSSITILSHNGTPTLKNNSGVGMTSVVDISNNNYVTIKNITFDGYYSGIVMDGGNYNIIENNTLINGYDTAIRLTSTRNSIARNNTLRNTYWNSLQVSGDSVLSDNNTIEYNNISELIAHGGIDLTGNITNTYIKHNNIFNSTAFSGIYAHQTAGSGYNNAGRVYIENNTIYNTTYGIFFDDPLNNSIIAYNTIRDIYNCSSASGNKPFKIGSVDADLMTNITLDNNSAYDCGKDNIFIGIITNSELKNNNFTNSTGAIGEYRFGSSVSSSIVNMTDNWNSKLKYNVRRSAETIVIGYTDNRLFSLSNGGTVSFYPNISNYTLNTGTSNVLVTYYTNIIIKPQQNYVTASNTSTALLINYSSNAVSRLNTTIDKTSSLNLSGLTQDNYSLYYSNNTLIETKNASSNMANFSSIPAGSYYITESTPTPAPTTTPSASAYVQSTCASTLNWGIVGGALLTVLLISVGGILAFGFMSGTFKMDTFPIQEFTFTIVAVVVIGSIGVALIQPIITVVGCP